MELICILISCLMFEVSLAVLRCGNDEIQHGIAKGFLVNDCKGRMGKIDACCVAHKNCYDNRVPQNVCDDTFCKCVEDSANKMPTCTFHAGNFCTFARLFGALQYNKPRPPTRV